MSKRNWILDPPECCDEDASLVTGRDIYPHRRDLWALKFWRCDECGAYTGTHVDSKTHAPKGRLADDELRQLRIEAHAAFDPLWKSGNMKRRNAYAWARSALRYGRPFHIGWASAEDLRKLIAAVKKRNFLAQPPGYL